MSRVITFYSYKGGAGRSMALANIAWVLASAGKRVLVIDWDLEAPGLHRYFQPFLTDKELSGQESQGVIDMAIDFAVRAATPVKDGEELDGTWYDALADFSKWRQKLRWPSGETIRLGKNGRGEIDFVPAGRQGADYAKRVNRFDWHSLYEKLGGGAFFNSAKRKFDVYDYVLIDSRTGVSDTSGICTVHMPDTLVVCFTLNYQSIKGALAVAQSVREQRPEIRIFPVPMRIDGSEDKSLNRMKSYAASVFGPLLDSKINARDYWYLMEVPYFARYSYAEKLALFEEQASVTTSTLPAMERMSGYLTDGDVRTAGSLPEAERVLALAEFERIEEAGKANSLAQHTKPHVVIFVQGIRTTTLWHNELRRVLEKEGFIVELTNYGYLSLLRLLSPLQLFTREIVDRIAEQVRNTLALNPGADCSIIANGFGTVLVARMLRDHSELAFSRIIFCGSVVPYGFPFERFLPRFKMPLLNEVGTRDFWPVIAEAATFGSGSTGTYGFGRPGVFDRWHNGKAASDFLNQEFCREYWVPFFSEGLIVRGDASAERSPWWLRAVSLFPIKYLVLLAVAGIIVGPFVWTNLFYINQFRPYVLSSPTEQALKPGDSFKECATACPEMIVVPAGSFIMGSPKDEQGRAADEGPQHQVTITKPFAVSKFELIFEHWDVCAKHGDCDPKISDSGWGRGQQPAISVTWQDAHRYVAWLSRMTGKRYRLLSEAEWEYAGRAGTSTRYSFGNDVSALGEYAWFVENSNKQAHSVGEKKPNNFSLHDMQGNAWEWVEDCYHPDYSGAPADGSAWTEAECSRRVARGGSWSDNPRSLRIATRNSSTPDLRLSTLGFRVARTLAP